MKCLKTGKAAKRSAGGRTRILIAGSLVDADFLDADKLAHAAAVTKLDNA